MSRKALVAAMLVAVVAGCAAKKETVYAEQSVTTEPVFTGKYGN